MVQLAAGGRSITDDTSRLQSVSGMEICVRGDDIARKCTVDVDTSCEVTEIPVEVCGAGVVGVITILKVTLHRENLCAGGLYIQVVPVVDSVVIAPSLEEAPLSVAEPVVPSVEDDVAPEASPCASLEDAPSVDVASDDVPSEEDVLLPDSLEVASEDAESLPDSLAGATATAAALAMQMLR